MSDTQPIVVEYQAGGSLECPDFTHTLTFMYESPEKWMRDFRQALEAAFESYQKVQAARAQPLAEWRARRPLGEDRAAVRQWFGEIPKLPTGTETFTFAGAEFWLAEFLLKPDDFWQLSDRLLPKAWALQEWFAKTSSQTQMTAAQRAQAFISDRYEQEEAHGEQIT